MVIAIFGESCTGKSTLAEMLKDRLGAEIYTGKDYLRLAKNESMAKMQFRKLLSNANETNIIYVIAEKPHLDLLPENAFRVLVTADLELIKTRFAARMRGNLPAPVAQMLEKNHGSFDAVPHDMHYVSDRESAEEALNRILNGISGE